MNDVKSMCDAIVEEVSEKFGYDSVDQKRCDSLKTVLQKVVYVMCKSAEPEERELLFQVLRNTPIAIIDKIDEKKYQELYKEYIGDVNSHIKEDITKLGEYGKQEGAGAFVSTPLFSDGLDLIGKKGFIYIEKVQGRVRDFYGTDINVSHLIHELGHAWHAEKDGYIFDENGMLKERIGSASFSYSLTPKEDGNTMKKLEDVTGLVMEEAMNTVDEENYMAEYMGLTLKEMQEVYETTLVSSNYQGYLGEFARYMLQELGKDELEHWRLHGDLESKSKIEELMKKTPYWKNREEDISEQSTSSRSYKNKRAIIERSSKSSKRVKKFFDENMEIYFPDISTMSPLEKIDNALRQYHDMKVTTTCYNMGIEDYSDLLKCISDEGYTLVNETALLKTKEAVKGIVESVTLSRFNSDAQAFKTLNEPEQEKTKE